VISKQKLTQNTNHYLWFVITSQNTFVISKRAHYPRSDTEFYGGIVFPPLYQTLKYVLTSWYCNSFFRSVPWGVIFY